MFITVPLAIIHGFCYFPASYAIINYFRSISIRIVFNVPFSFSLTISNLFAGRAKENPIAFRNKLNIATFTELCPVNCRGFPHDIITSNTLYHSLLRISNNVFKRLYDALNGLAYRDDNQIVSATVEKWYSNNPRVEVEIKEIGA
jgi:Holliday junction resolvase RusA-like endonuclease